MAEGSVDLAAVLAAVGLEAAPERARLLVEYLRLLQRWNGAYNLTAIRDPEAMRVQHLHDCLAVLAPLRQAMALAWHATPRQAAKSPRRFDGPLRVLDVGSGGGLPGAVIAIVEPGWQVFCLDAVGKKAAFVRQVAGELGLENLHALHGRVERSEQWAGADAAGRLAFDLVISRAFATIADFVEGTQRLVKPEDGLWAAMKGKLVQAELEWQAVVGKPVLTRDGAAQLELVTCRTIDVPHMDAERSLVVFKASVHRP